MKKYIYSILIIALFSACDVDLKPDSELIYKGFWDSEEAVRTEHAGICAEFREYNSTLWQLGELRSDIWGGKTQESPFSVNFINNNITTALVPFENWAGGFDNKGNPKAGFYRLIHYINDFIKNAPNVSMSNEADKNHMLGQVYGLRAYVYYTMLKTWGKVPLTIEPLPKVESIVTLKKGRAPKAEVIDQIKSDIQKSLDYFGSDNNLWKNSRSYWSKAATLTLKGDVYLWSGKVEGGGRVDFEEAKKALEVVKGFSLVDTYAKLWGQDNENNSEFIFTFHYAVNQKNSFYNNFFTGYTRNIWETFTSEGKSLKGFNSSGQNRYGPSEKIIRLLQKDKQDTRGANTFIFMYTDDNGGNGYPTYVEDKYSGAILKKFLGEIVDGSRASYTNVPIYRYADVLLLLAEAKNNLGEDPSAEINKVRERAYKPNVAPVYSNKTQAENTKAILDERLKEFIGEGKRWWDLLRAGENFKYVFDEVSTLTPADAYKIYLPLTQNMLSDDETLEQTEGY